MFAQRQRLRLTFTLAASRGIGQRIGCRSIRFAVVMTGQSPHTADAHLGNHRILDLSGRCMSSSPSSSSSSSGPRPLCLAADVGVNRNNLPCSEYPLAPGIALATTARAVRSCTIFNCCACTAYMRPDMAAVLATGAGCCCPNPAAPTRSPCPDDPTPTTLSSEQSISLRATAQANHASANVPQRERELRAEKSKLSGL
eukprot:m.395806 g.395806  ORF g.395806 m.395806 type:complete len:199 (+) comp20101_c0_seq40:3159-3755(+)